MRGAAGADGLVPYLLAAAVHGTGTVTAERLIGPKTNEVPQFAPLLRELNEYYCLAGHVITADAGHTVRAHATLICGELLAHYVLTVKQNTPRLWADLDALDGLGGRARPARDRGGRARTPRASHHPGHERPGAHQGRFPHVRQAALIERYVTRAAPNKKGRRWVKKTARSAIAVFIITSLDAREAAPVHLAATSAASGR